MTDASTVGIPDIDMRLTEALVQCSQGDPRGIEMADILLKDMKKRAANQELEDAAALWLQAGYACLSQPNANDETIGWGYDLLRMAVRYLKEAGSNERLIMIAKEQTEGNPRLALRAYASVSKEHVWSVEERDAALQLAEALQNTVKSTEDVLRIRDALIVLKERRALVAFAETLDNKERHTWAQAIYAVIDEDEVTA